MIAALRAQRADDVLVLAGGVIPAEDIPALKAAGIAEVFTPGTPTRAAVEFIRQRLQPA